MNATARRLRLIGHWLGPEASGWPGVRSFERRLLDAQESIVDAVEW